jgi:hypothetical protein
MRKRYQGIRHRQISPQSAALRSVFKQSCGIGTVMQIQTLGYQVERRSEPVCWSQATGDAQPRKGVKAVKISLKQTQPEGNLRHFLNKQFIPRLEPVGFLGYFL